MEGITHKQTPPTHPFLRSSHNEGVKDTISYCRKALEEVIYFGDRLYAPDATEISFVEANKKLGMEVSLVDGRKFVIKIGPQTSGQDAAAAVRACYLAYLSTSSSLFYFYADII